MVDLSQTIAPKSDQINADDLIGGDMTITISQVTKGQPDQPINIFFENGGNKPFRPCKSMRRVLVTVWGNDGTSYVGKSLTLYRDAGVTFGGMAVGGIRISHMSHISKPHQMALTATKGKRALYTVKPLKIEVQTPAEQRETTSVANTDAPQSDKAAAFADGLVQQIEAAQNEDALKEITSGKRYVDGMSRLRDSRPELADRVTNAVAKLLDGFDPFAGEAA